MKRGLAALLTLAVLTAWHPLLAAAAPKQNTGEIAGTAVIEGKPLANITVRLRNVDSGRLEGTMLTNEKGEFRFTGLPVGNYVVETVAQNGTLLGTSVRLSLVSGAMLATGVTVSTSAAAAAAVGLGAGAGAAGAGAGAAGAGAGAAGAGAAGAAAGASAAGAAAGVGAAGAAAGAAAAGGAFFATTAGIVTAVAVGAGVAAAVTVAATASPSS